MKFMVSVALCTPCDGLGLSWSCGSLFSATLHQLQQALLVLHRQVPNVAFDCFIAYGWITLSKVPTVFTGEWET